MDSRRSKYLLDSSALLVFMEDEAGADKVQDILRNKKVILPFVVLLEVYYITLREKGPDVADRRYAMIKSLDVEIKWQMDESTLMLAGKYKAQYRISLADAMIAAFAKTENAILVHKDPEYEALKGEVEQITLPYK